MTTAETRSPRSPWIKRAVIGGTAALMIGGGIGVAANAAPGEVPVTGPVTGRGLSEQEARENAESECEQLGLGAIQDGPARPVPGGREGEVDVTMQCTDTIGDDPPGDDGSVDDGPGDDPGDDGPGDDIPIP